MTEQEMLVKIELDKYFDNVCVVFGILGNIKAESNCRGNNLQNSFEPKLGFTDETYTQAINDGTYTCDQFQNDHAGYGLCQWTYWSRKKALYEFWKFYLPYMSIDSVLMQVRFINYEMNMTLKSKLESCQTVEEAARIFMLEYEKPANQSEENIAKRCEIARDLCLDYLSVKYEENAITPVADDRASISEDNEAIYESKKGYSYLQIVNSLESMKVYLDIMIDAVKSLAEEDSHD